MAKRRLEGQPAMSENSGIEFFKEEQFSEGDKLALLNFLMREFSLTRPVVMRGADSAVAAQFLVEQYVSQNACIDLLYLNSDALRDCSPSQIAPLWDLLSRKGVICIESSGAAETIDAGVLPTGAFDTVMASPGFSIFARVDGERPLRSMCYQVDLFRRKLCFDRKRRSKRTARAEMPEVAVVVLTYKHESYIAECLRSVLNQRGQFRMRVIIINDASPDATAQVVKSMIAESRDDRINIDFQTNAHNVGVVANLAKGMREAAGCDYLTFCEGDDFWSSEKRIQEHIDFLQKLPDAVMSFNTIELCGTDGSSRETFADHAALKGDRVDGPQLAENNLIGNFTACFYRGELVDVIPQEIFNLYAVDWLINLYCAQFGPIAHLKKSLSVYRQHEGGEWSARRELDKINTLLSHIADYNAFLDFNYDEGLQAYSRKLYALLDEHYSDSAEKLDLIVFDDVFPSSRSGFRYVEFTSYLRTFPKSLTLTSGASLPVLEDTPIKDVIRTYQRQHPDLGNRVMTYTDQFPMRLGKLVYVNFLTNAYAMLSDLEAARVPFVFTLYPGAGFVLNNPKCDLKLKRVFDSPCFQRVIVTQQVTYDYIVHRGLCPAAKVQMIFGVVMPEIPEGRQLPAKCRWGFDKSRLDICFMAHKYTPYGEDKGYDVFVNVASILRQRHDDIYFHVVGPFDRRVIDVSSFSDRIKFHGSLNPDEFDSFFRDKDLIMSPNISGKISPGAFDGFPTASCTEAGLRGTAIFAVDEFNSAKGRFTDGEDIVLINYDLMDIVDKVERHYADPAGLKEVGERAVRRIRELYSLEAQMGPRIELLREVIRNPVLSSKEMSPVVLAGANAQVIEIGRPQKRSLAWEALRRTCPETIKKIYRDWKRKNHASQ